MKRHITLIGVVAGLAALVVSIDARQAQTDKPTAIVNANTASEATLAALPHMNAARAKALVGKRPFASVMPFDMFLVGQGLSRMQISELYGRAFVPIDLNSATREEIMLIPGVGTRMAREFLEYRPYKAIEQFRREIGKYVSKEEVARLERYVTIK
jgi:DNA uptake protein ComE-like DNA-binding protein